MSNFKKPGIKKSEKKEFRTSQPSGFEDQESKIQRIKEKKKLKSLASKLKYPSLENELEEEGK